MDFSKQLNTYISIVDSTSNDLVVTSTLSPTVISRYRNGKRTPSIKSIELKKLVNGIYILYKKNGIEISKELINNSLTESLGGLPIDTKKIISKFNLLSSTLNINLRDFSKKIIWIAL